MILTLHTETTIDSAHNLEGYNGKCSELHGHTWKLEFWFRGDTNVNNNQDKVGIMVDFGIVKEIKEILDHKYINDIIGINPTAENLTMWLYGNLKNMINKPTIQIKVRVYETAVDKQTYCEGGDF